MTMQAIELGARTVLQLSGGDRERFLNGQVSNDVRKLTAENSVETTGSSIGVRTPMPLSV